MNFFLFKILLKIPYLNNVKNLIMKTEEVVEIVKKTFNKENDLVSFEYQGVHGPDDTHKHYFLKVVSDSFEWLTRIQRHRKINEILWEHVNSWQIHALKIKTLTHDENI